MHVLRDFVPAADRTRNYSVVFSPLCLSMRRLDSGEERDFAESVSKHSFAALDAPPSFSD